MFTKRAALLAVAASLLMGAAPVQGAETYSARESGTTINATFTNLPVDQEAPAPGEYFILWVFAASELGGSLLEHDAQDVCVFRIGVTVDDSGSYGEESWFSACGQLETLSIDRRLSTGRVIAEFPAIECAAWDEESGGCLEFVDLGTVAIDLTVTGFGDVSRYRGVSTGGSAGMGTYIYHGTGSSRQGTPSGTVTLDGVSLTDGATYVDAQLAVTKTGWIEVYLGE